MPFFSAVSKHLLLELVRLSLCVQRKNYYSVTDNIFQLIVDFWHMLLVNDDDDDVGYSLAFLYDCAVLRFLNTTFIFLCVWVCA